MPIARTLLRLCNRVELWLDWLRSLPTRWALKHCGRNVLLKQGLKINHPECVSLGDDAYISECCWISLLPVNRQKNAPDIALVPRVSIGSRCYIGRFAMFACMNEIHIGDDVMISDRVFIGDCSHGFAERALPIKDQYMFSNGPVSIGDGAWLGVNVCILPNVRIGRGCVIGANAVVTEDVPDYHVAVGAPARSIKKLSSESN